MKHFILSVAIVLLAVVGLVACGGGGSSPSTPSATVATPAPVSYGGTYKGTMIDNFQANLMRYDAEVTIVHQGTTVTAEVLLLTNAFGVVSRYPVGAANLSSGSFDIASSYNSKGCGGVAYRVHGFYSGDGGLLNLTYQGSTDTCGGFDMRGELRR